jgi:hypothetical protein
MNPEKEQRERKCNYCGGTGFAATRKLEFVKPKLLLVEGRDDERFFTAFLKKKNINNIHIEIYEGKENLPTVLKSLHVRPGYSTLTSVAIVRDADEEKGEIVFEKIKILLKKTDLSIPQNFAEFTHQNPRIGIFVLPGKNKTGELEDILLESISNSPLMEPVKTFISSIKELNSIKKIAKSHLYAWLSSQNPPDLRLGQAANNGLFDFNHLAFDELADFINKLNTN